MFIPQATYKCLIVFRGTKIQSSSPSINFVNLFFIILSLPFSSTIRRRSKKSFSLRIWSANFLSKKSDSYALIDAPFGEIGFFSWPNISTPNSAESVIIFSYNEKTKNALLKKSLWLTVWMFRSPPNQWYEKVSLEQRNPIA